MTLSLTSGAWALKQDSEEPIVIQAQDAEINQTDQEVVYHGAVEVQQGSLDLKAERMIVKYEGKKVVLITALGSPAEYQQTLEDSRGKVRAHADTIVYRPQAEQMDLRGKAELNQQGNQIRSDQITYDIVDGRVKATSADRNPVRMVIQPAAAEAADRTEN